MDYRVIGIDDGDEANNPGDCIYDDKDTDGDDATQRRILRASVALALTGIIGTSPDGQKTAAQGDAISILIPGIGHVSLLIVLGLAATATAILVFSFSK